MPTRDMWSHLARMKCVENHSIVILDFLRSYTDLFSIYKIVLRYIDI